MSKDLFENDLSPDSFRWAHLLEEKQLLNPTFNHQILEQIQSEIIKTQDAALAYFFAAQFGYKSYRMQQVILDRKDAKYALIFASNIKDCDVRALQKVVAESKKIKYICKFAYLVKNAKRKPLEKLVLTSNKPKYIFELAQHTSNIKNLNTIQDLIIKSGSFTYMRLFAERIKQADVDKIEQAVLDTNNTVEIKKFAKYVRRSRMKRFFLVM
jgi:hypothetical protein